MNSESCISATIVTYNNSNEILPAVDSVLSHTKGRPLTLYVVDNNSTDNTVALLKDKPVKLVKNDKNIGFGAAHNKILELEMGKYHAVINPDIEICEDTLTHLADILDQNPDICMITPRVLNPDGTEQVLPKRTPNARYLFLGRLASLGGPFKKIREEYTMFGQNLKEITDVEFCSGCFFMIRSEVFKDLGGFDERYFMYMEDADLTRMAKKYGRTVFCNSVSVVHRWNRGSAKDIRLLFRHIASFAKYRKKWRNAK